MEGGSYQMKMNISFQLETLKKVAIHYLRSQQVQDHEFWNRNDWIKGQAPMARALSRHRGRKTRKFSCLNTAANNNKALSNRSAAIAKAQS
jgi:hypothetical protein